MVIQIDCLMVIRLAMIPSRRLGSEVKKFSRVAAAGVYGLTILSISFVNGPKKNIVDEAKAAGYFEIRISMKKHAGNRTVFDS